MSENKKEKIKVYLIKSIEEYGKFVAYCIYKDINVWRLYYDDSTKGQICFNINWKEKRCYYGSLNYYLGEHDDVEYEVVLPEFEIDKFGRVKLIN